MLQEPAHHDGGGRRGEQNMFAFHTLTGLLQVLPPSSLLAITVTVSNLYGKEAPDCTAGA